MIWLAALQLLDFGNLLNSKHNLDGIRSNQHPKSKSELQGFPTKINNFIDA